MFYITSFQNISNIWHIFFRFVINIGISAAFLIASAIFTWSFIILPLRRPIHSKMSFENSVVYGESDSAHPQRGAFVKEDGMAIDFILDKGISVLAIDPLRSIKLRRPRC